MTTQARFLGTTSSEIIAGYRERSKIAREQVEEFNQVFSKNARLEKEVATRSAKLICPLSLQKYLLDNIAGFKAEAFQSKVRTHFKQGKALQIGACLVNALTYTSPSAFNHMDYRDRLIEYITDLHLIGSGTTSSVLSAFLLTKPSYFVIKVDPDNFEDLFHEATIAFVGTNSLRDSIPNFMYVFALFDCGPPHLRTDKKVASFCGGANTTPYLLIENLYNSISIRDYLPDCSVDEFLSYFLQLVFSLAIAKREVDFTHYDLHDKNVLLRGYDMWMKEWQSEDFLIPYAYGGNLIYVKAHFVAIIIDYGMSHITQGEKHYGYLRPGSFTYGVYNDRSFPLFDIYKNLMFCLYNAVKLGRDDLVAIIVKIKSYFNLEPIDNLEILRHYLFASRWLSEDNFIFANFLNWLSAEIPQIRNVLLTDPNGIKVLQCPYGVCPVMSELVSTYVIPSAPQTFLQFFDSLSLGLRDAEVLKREFDIKTAYQENLDVVQSTLKMAITIADRLEQQILKLQASYSELIQLLDNIARLSDEKITKLMTNHNNRRQLKQIKLFLDNYYLLKGLLQRAEMRLSVARKVLTYLNRDDLILDMSDYYITLSQLLNSNESFAEQMDIILKYESNVDRAIG